MILGLNERQETNVVDWLGTVTLECTPGKTLVHISFIARPY